MAHKQHESLRADAEEAAEEDWLSVLHSIGFGGARYFANCTPSFYNSEQQAIDALLRALRGRLL